MRTPLIADFRAARRVTSCLARRSFAFVAIAAALGAFGLTAVNAAHAEGASPDGLCEPTWVPTFDGQPGVNAIVRALTVFDDRAGDGPSLYAGGGFTSAAGISANRIARWDGEQWSPLGDGLDNVVLAITGTDEAPGGGPALYAGGAFTTAGGVPANRIARWDGAEWSALGSGVDGTVYALAVFDDGSGSGPALFVGGTFTDAGGAAVKNIAKWDGNTWSSPGSGVNDRVSALKVFDDGSGNGPALYAGGDFTAAGDERTMSIAKWDGTEWSSLGGGMDEPVSALTVFDDGSDGGPALYAGGAFTTAGGVPANRIAKWNGAQWSSPGSGIDGAVVRAFATTDDESADGPVLYAAGVFSAAGGVEAYNLAQWDGIQWSPVGFGVIPNLHAVSVFDDGTGEAPALYVGGNFLSAPGELWNVSVRHITKWDGSRWMPIGNGFSGYGHTPNSTFIAATAVFDDGSGRGPLLYAGGQFLHVGGKLINCIATWDGAEWSPLGSGIHEAVNSLATFDDGSGHGPSLYVGGTFDTAGGIDANNIARWDGESWSPLGAGISGSGSYSVVWSLAVFDDGSGSGPALFAGGKFTIAGGESASRVAKWDGTQWSPLSGGVNGTVYALQVFDDGSGDGPALYVGGDFTSAGGVPANNIAKWDGVSWSPLGNGVIKLNPTSSFVRALTLFDDGSGGGPALYVGGSFTQAGDVAANFIAKWDGAQWSTLGSGIMGMVHAMTVFDDGTGKGPSLYAGGWFYVAGGNAANSIAAWDGARWSPLGDGVDGDTFAGTSVYTLTALHDIPAIEPSLLVGGDFATSAAGDRVLARWQGCAAQPPCARADLNCDGVIDESDLLLLLQSWGACADPDACPADLNGDGIVDIADLLILLAEWD